MGIWVCLLAICFLWSPDCHNMVVLIKCQERQYIESKRMHSDSICHQRFHFPDYCEGAFIWKAGVHGIWILNWQILCQKLGWQILGKNVKLTFFLGKKLDWQCRNYNSVCDKDGNGHQYDGDYDVDKISNIKISRWWFDHMMLIKYKSDEDDDDAFISVLTVSLRPHPRSFPLLQCPGTRVKLLQVLVHKCSPEHHRRIHTLFLSLQSYCSASALVQQ